MSKRTPDEWINISNYDGNGWSPDGSEKAAIDKTLPPDRGRNNYSTKTCKLVITYYANGAETGNPPPAFTQTYSGKLQTVTMKETVKDNENTPPMTKAGYYFLGWAKTAAGNVYYNPGDVITKEWAANASGTDSHSLYAVWTNHSIFIYKPDNKSNETRYKYSDKPLNQQATIAGALFTRKGYEQVGWATSSGGAKVYNLGQTYTATSDAVLVLYPVWQAKEYTITYYPNGATGSSSQVSVIYDTDVEIPLELYSRTGYHVTAWNESPNGSGSSWIPGATYTYTRASNLKLYAMWVGNEYYFIYDDGSTESTKLLIKGDLVSSLQKDGEDCLYSSNLHKTENDLLYLSPPDYAYLEIDEENSPYYSIATFGQPFYTERRPKPDGREYYSFNGWQIWSTSAGSYFNATKQDAWYDAYSILANPRWIWTNNIVGKARWSDNYPFGKIFFGGKYSDDFGIYVEEPPSYIWPEHSYDHHKVNGKHGDVLTDFDRFENVTKKYKISAYDGSDFYTVARKVSDWLHHGFADGYMRLEDSYEPDCYMLAVYEESNTLENQLGKAGRCEITFNCKPQRFLISGDRKVDIRQSGLTITNPTNYPSSPLIKFYGAGTIHVNGVEIVVYNNFNGITFDAETYNAVDSVGNNMNAYIYTLNPVRLSPGVNTITFDGDIYDLSIVPRWWKP
jgi:phage-related protein